MPTIHPRTQVDHSVYSTNILPKDYLTYVHTTPYHLSGHNTKTVRTFLDSDTCYLERVGEANNEGGASDKQRGGEGKPRGHQTSGLGSRQTVPH